MRTDIDPCPYSSRRARPNGPKELPAGRERRLTPAIIAACWGTLALVPIAGAATAARFGSGPHITQGRGSFFGGAIMSTTADAIIVGGGVMGCSIAYSLASMGTTDVVLLERDVLASGSTGRSQAMLRMHYSNEVTTRLAWESLRVFRDFDRMVGGTSGYARTGYLLIVGPGDRHALEENVAMQRRVGVDTSVVDLDDLRTIAPMCVFEDGEVVAYEPQSGYADPYLVATTYAARARDMGVDIRTGTCIRKFNMSGDRIIGASTAAERFEAPVVILAAGPWTGPFLAGLGVDVAIETVRHQVIVLRRPDGHAPDHPSIGDVVNSLSARPELGSLTLIGIGETEVAAPEEFDQGVDLSVVEEASGGLVRRMPGMAGATFRGGWSGLFTTTPDWHPILDRVPGVEGLYCAAGFSGHGFKLAPMVGVVMAELVLEGHSTTIDVSQLGFDRFKEGRPMRSRYGMSVLA